MKVLTKIKEFFTINRIIGIGIIVVLLIGLSRLDSCQNNRYGNLKAENDSLISLTQRLVQDTNKLGQVITKQAVTITEDKEAINKLTADIFNLKKKDQRRIQQVNSLIKETTNTKVDTTLVPLSDTSKPKFNADSCKEAIAYIEDSTVKVPQRLIIDSTKDKYFQFDATLTKNGLTINSVNFPDSQYIATVETGGWFKRDINGKLKLYQKRQLEIQVLHTNKYITVTGISSLIYKPKVKGRWVERLAFVGAGIYLGTQLVK